MRIRFRILLLALSSASLFWLLNALNKRYTTQLVLPLHYDYGKEEVVVVQSPPEEIQLNLTGMGWDLLHRKNWLYQTASLIISLDHSDEVKAVPKGRLYRLLQGQVRPLQLNEVLMDTLRLDVQSRSSKQVYVSFDSMSLRYAPYCRPYGPLVVSLDSFTLVGASDYVAAFPDELDVRMLDTDPPLNNSVNTLRFPLVLEHAEFLQAHPSDLAVSIDVALYKRQRIVLRVEPFNFPRRGRYRAVLEDTVLELSYVVRTDSATLIKPELFTVGADYTLRDRKRRVLTPLLLHAPAEVSDILFFPAHLRYHYENREQPQR